MRLGVGRALALASATALIGAASAQAAPNIVLVLTDDQRWDTLGVMPTVQEELVNRGVTFANAFAVDPLCCPSRASLLTGNYPHTTGVWWNGGRLGGWNAFRDDEASTLAVWLRAGGYRTGFLGKYLNSYNSTIVPPGWDRWYSFVPSNVANYVNHWVNVDGIVLPALPGEYSTDALAAEAVRFVESSPDPFFLLLAPYAPHAPATPAPRHRSALADESPWRPPSYGEPDVSDKPGYVRARPEAEAGAQEWRDDFRRDQLRSLIAVDEAVGEVLSTLERGGRLADTVVVFTSDNGLGWGEHRWFWKQAPYEESIRIPLVVRYDRLGLNQRVESRLAANVDLAPTLAELAGVPAPPMEGRSLVPLLTGAATFWRQELLLEHLRGRPSPNVPSYCALRGESGIYVQYGTGEEELYDLAADPYQLENKARDPAMRSAIVDYRRRVRAVCRPGPPGFRHRPACTSTGTRRANRLVGTEHFDHICARGGNDVVFAREERDVVVAGRGRDRVYAGAGDDRVLAKDGQRDWISCGDGMDEVWADARDRVGADCEIVR
jgi:arylsulfatase A-like enzyme